MMFEFHLILLACLLTWILDILGAETLNSTVISPTINSTESIIEVLPTPPHHAIEDTFDVNNYVYDISDLKNKLASEYDYYMLDPGDHSEKDNTWHENSPKFWGCFQKSNILMEGKAVNSKDEAGNPSIEKCRTMCSLNGKCKMWSFLNESVLDSNCFYEMEDEDISTLKFEFTEYAHLEFRTCSSGYVGCHIGSRTKRDAELVEEADDVHSCVKSCKEKYYPYAIFRDSEYCECDHSFPNPQITDENIKCVQESEQSDRYAIHKTGSEYADTELCIVASNLDYKIEGSVYKTGIDSISECRKLCDSYQNDVTPCLMWWYNVTHCKIITKTNKNGLFVESSNSFLGFGKCGGEDRTVTNEILTEATDYDTNIRNTQIAFIVAFCAVFLFLMLAITYICGCTRISKFTSKSIESSKDFSNSNNLHNEIHTDSEKYKHELVGLNDKLKTQRAKKRYVNIFSRPSIAFITTSNKNSRPQRPDVVDPKYSMVTRSKNDVPGCGHQTEYISLETYNKMTNTNFSMSGSSTK